MREYYVTHGTYSLDDLIPKIAVRGLRLYDPARVKLGLAKITQDVLKQRLMESCTISRY